MTWKKSALTASSRCRARVYGTDLQIETPTLSSEPFSFFIGQTVSDHAAAALIPFEPVALELQLLGILSHRPHDVGRGAVGHLGFDI